MITSSVYFAPIVIAKEARILSLNNHQLFAIFILLRVCHLITSIKLSVLYGKNEENESYIDTLKNLGNL